MNTNDFREIYFGVGVEMTNVRVPKGIFIYFPIMWQLVDKHD
jgi:hypothetical protein